LRGGIIRADGREEWCDVSALHQAPTPGTWLRGMGLSGALGHGLVVRRWTSSGKGLVGMKISITIEG
jgi:hypothetical protein